MKYTEIILPGNLKNIKHAAVTPGSNEQNLWGITLYELTYKHETGTPFVGNSRGRRSYGGSVLMYF